jgi:hypothetical protein
MICIPILKRGMTPWDGNASNDEIVTWGVSYPCCKAAQPKPNSKRKGKSKKPLILIINLSRQVKKVYDKLFDPETNVKEEHQGPDED